MIDKIGLSLLTMFGIGHFKYAPGTIASFVTCLIFFLLNNFLDIYVIFLLTLAIFFLSIISINFAYKNFDSNDPQEIVIDEFIGQMLPLLAIPIYETLYPTHKIYYCIIVFVLFRFFDILKPFPINYIDENTKGAFGIMFDDIIAGVFTIILFSISLFFLGG